MSKTDLPSLPETSSEASEGNAPAFPLATGSVSDAVALRMAIAGYMCDRQTLVESMPPLNLEYEVHRKKRAWVIEEITRIDVAVAALLSPNVADQPRPRDQSL
jgi:hypothetical protein